VITLDLSERKEEEEQISKRTVAIIIITIIDESHWDGTIKRQREDTFFYSFFSLHLSRFGWQVELFFTHQ